MHTKRPIAAALGLAALASGATLAADPATLKWDSVPKSQITLFYPGQSTQEWMVSAAHKAGARRG